MKKFICIVLIIGGLVMAGKSFVSDFATAVNFNSARANAIAYID